MATNPTRSVERHDVESPLTADIRAVAERLAAIEPSPDVPMTTVSLDWRIEGTNPGRTPFYPEGTRPDDGRKRSQPDRPADEREEESARRRPTYRLYRDEMDEIVESHGPHGPVFDSLSGDAERISAYLEGEVDPTARGVFIVSCTGRDLFEPVQLATPLATRVSTSPTPDLTELVRVGEDFPSFAALLADQREARLLVVTHAVTERSVHVEGTDFPRHQQQGGWSQRRYQARADERIEAFARDVADETRKELDSLDVDTLVIAGDEVITSALDRELHQTVKVRLAATIHLDIRATDQELVDASLPVALAAERAREADAVRRMSDGVGAGTYGAGGASDVLTALQAGQVETLVMNDDFEANGWADFTMPAYGSGDLPTSHPLGGEASSLVAIDLRAEMVRLALQTGAEVEIVHTAIPDDAEGAAQSNAGGPPRSKAARTLDEHGGVGAVLRYVIGDEPSEEESAAQAQDQDRR